jgi:hypothetical protein
MKKIFILLVMITCLYNCNKATKTTPTSNKSTIKTHLNSVLNNWHRAASDADYNGYFGEMDSISVFIGTDATENWTKKQFEAFSKPHFDKGKAWDFKTLERNIYLNSSGNFAWFDELLNTWMGTCRGSGVLEKKNASWKIKHYVLSVSIPNDAIKEVIAAKKKGDSIFLNRSLQ